ncbi:MAG: DUF3467 domain-containing protein [Chloroflexi bacterium]|nr:DUF3467 domain-containing protein [Chloroflexota bacterium]
MDEEVPSYYASGLNVVVSPWDITLRFSIREGDTPKDIRPVANVILSPQHAWILARLLRKQIDAYEQQVGKINLPPRLLNDLGVED